MPRKRTTTAPSGYAILIVDDQEETLISTQLLLEREGHQVLTAPSGPVALSILDRVPVDLLIIDYFMPLMNGQQLVEAVRERDNDVQILLQTGYSGEKPAREMMRALDIQGYHDKADGPDRLLLWVEVALKFSRQLCRIKEAEQELLESHAQLRRLSTRLLNLQEEERERISRELHDHLGQLLTAVSLDLDWSLRHCPGELAELCARLKESKRVADEAIYTTRQLCATLRVNEWKDRDLAASLRDYAAEFERRSGLSVHFSAPPGDRELDPEATRNIYRITQEALNNVVRHAEAGSVSVSLRRSENSLILSVTDNGKGFEVNKVRDPLAIGIIGMRERARLAGGTLEVRSAPGAGTSVELTIPIAERGN